MNRIHHIRLSPRRTTAIAAITAMVRDERHEHYAGEDVEILVDGAHWLPTTLPPDGMRFRLHDGTASLSL